jgi:hypothetical protein
VQGGVAVHIDHRQLLGAEAEGEGGGGAGCEVDAPEGEEASRALEIARRSRPLRCVSSPSASAAASIPIAACR